MLLLNEFKPNKYQKELLNIFDNYEKSITLSHRQMGTTLAIAVYTLKHAMIYNRKIYMFTPNNNTNYRFIELCKNLYTSYLPSGKPGLYTLNKNEIKFDTGGRIHTFPLIGYSIRGMEKPNTIFIDNLALAKNNNLSDIEPLTEDCNIHIISTPNKKDDILYKLWIDDNNFHKTKIPFIPQTQEERILENTLKTTLSYSRFNAEYKCEFIPIQEKSDVVNLRITPEEKQILLKKSENLHFRSISEYLRFVGLNSNIKVD